MVDGNENQARTSTIVPLKTSSAFWISGSFLNSSLLNGTGRGFLSAGAAGAASAGFGGSRRGLGGGGSRRGVAATLGASQPAGASALTNLIMRIGVAEFRELGCEQRVVARVVHQAEVVRKFRIEADDQDILLERHRMGVEQDSRA